MAQAVHMKERRATARIEGPSVPWLSIFFRLNCRDSLRTWLSYLIQLDPLQPCVNPIIVSNPTRQGFIANSTGQSIPRNVSNHETVDNLIHHDSSHQSIPRDYQNPSRGVSSTNQDVPQVIGDSSRTGRRVFNMEKSTLEAAIKRNLNILEAIITVELSASMNLL